MFSEHRDLFIAIFESETENTRVLPLLTWEKSPSGARKWRFDAADGALVQALEGQVPVLGGLHGPEQLLLDPLVGLVTIPYFLPELRKNWRAWQPLVKNGKSNYIGPASIPVVALMHRRALLNSAFIRNAEARIDAARESKRHC